MLHFRNILCIGNCAVCGSGTWFRKKELLLMKKNLTDTLVNELKVKKSRYAISDKMMIGLYVYVDSSGKKTFRGRCMDTVSKKRIQVTLGTFPEMSVSEAREALSKVSRHIGYESDILTFEKFVRENWDYLVKQDTRTRRPLGEKTIKEYKIMLKNHIFPNVGDLEMKKFENYYIMPKFKYLINKKTTYNHCMVLIKRLMNSAVRMGVIDKNIFSYKAVECTKDHYNLLNSNIIRKIFEYMDNIDSSQNSKNNTRVENFHETTDIIRLLILSGRRKSEILNLQWHEVSMEDKLFKFVVDEKRSVKTEKIYLMSDETHEIMRKIQDRTPPQCRTGDVFVKKNVDSLWKKIKRDLDIKSTINECRHTYITQALQTLSPALVKGLAGHKNIKTTMRYCHIHKEHLRDAVNKVSVL